CSAAVEFSAERYRTTRSGFRATTASMFGLIPSPTAGTCSASAGYLHHVVRPTTRSPAPSANNSSVDEGASETTRRAGAASVTVRPASSVTTSGRADGRSDGRVHDASAAITTM